MGIMGYGYGSQFHLLRYLGYHRAILNRKIEEKTGGHVLNWLDFPFDPKGRFPNLDSEWKGLDFLDSNLPVTAVWKQFWPQTGNVPNWDAVGLLHSGSQVEYLLVEAKAHATEIKSDCSAKEHGGRPKILEAFYSTIKAYGLNAEPEKWLSRYYQYANRLTHLHFLTQHSVPARLIFIYFLGDDFSVGCHDSREPVLCPKTEQEWDQHLQEMYAYLGLGGESELERRVHRLFIQVSASSGSGDVQNATSGQGQD